MTIELSDLPTATFSTTRSADRLCSDLSQKVGWRHRYVAARLALTRSLSLSAPPPPLTEEDHEDMATAIRGMQLFGEGIDLSTWFALIVQRSGHSIMSRRSFRALVAAHWKRGAELLVNDWEYSNGSMMHFVARLAELADFTYSTVRVDHPVGISDSSPPIASEVRLVVGEVGDDLGSGETVEFALNSAGGSPHMAIMGGVGSGKTRTAVHMLKALRRLGNLPILAFDFKGDLFESLCNDYNAEVLRPPEQSIPLDVLHVGSTEDTLVKTAAARIRDSIASVKSKRPTGIQSEALREAIASTLRTKATNRSITLRDVAQELVREYEDRGRGPDELTSTLNELTQFSLFVPDHAPADFFAKSWIVQLPQDSSEEMRRLIINLTLNALDRWINSLIDTPSDSTGFRALRHVTMLDEAHVILKTRLPALNNLVRMSRSKGGVIFLISQSPDDFENAEDGYLDNMGMTVAFNTQANPGPTKRIFGKGHSLSSLGIGEALCRIRLEAKTRKIVSWRP